MILINTKPVNPINFPAGEVGVRLEADHFRQSIMERKGHYTIEWRFENNSEYFILAQSIDAIKRATTGLFKCQFHLFIPYFPYARQDRAVNEGEANALAVFCKALNELDINTIHTFDPHSLALEQHFTAGKLTYAEQDECFFKTTSDEFQSNVDLMIAPDAGAVKKAQKIANELQVDMAICFKTRDKLTGEVTKLKISVSDNLWNAKKILVVDDICDGGATFIKVAEAIREVNPNADLYLFTTHGIYSKGKEVLLKHYKEIACAYNFTPR